MTCYRCNGHTTGRGLCPQHSLYARMRYAAASKGKSVPTWEELDALYRPTCRLCGTTLVYASQTKATNATTASLQHWTGALHPVHEIICTACNKLDAWANKWPTYSAAQKAWLLHRLKRNLPPLQPQLSSFKDRTGAATNPSRATQTEAPSTTTARPTTPG